MIVSHAKDVKGIKIESPQANQVVKKVLVSPEQGWEGYVMRQFELGVGGYTPRHTHAWPHIGYILKGQGVLHIDGRDYEVREGSFAFVPGDQIHQFSNRGQETFVFICIVPEEGDK